MLLVLSLSGLRFKTTGTNLKKNIFFSLISRSNSLTLFSANESSF